MPPTIGDAVPTPGRVATGLAVAFVTIAGLAVLAGGIALLWFGIDMLEEFAPRNVTSGHPFNPRTPDDEQRSAYLFDTSLLIAGGAGLVLSVLIPAWASFRRRSRRRRPRRPA